MAQHVTRGLYAADRSASEIFGRTDELAMIRGVLNAAGESGILIEGGIGVGKSRLAAVVFAERGGADLWIRGDRVHQNVDFGAFGLLVDLDADPATLLSRVLEVLTSSRRPRTVFIDDAHLLDTRSQGVLADLASSRSIRLVVLSRSSTDDGAVPFASLVEDRVLQHLVLDVLAPGDYRNMIEGILGDVVSQSVVDIVDFHSGRSPGRLIELLEYTSRRDRFLLRRGVWVLDGLDIDYDERARDYARISLADYSAKQVEALELVVLAGEVQLSTLLEAGLGEAADALVASGELRIDPARPQTYEAVESHATDTLRFTTPTGRSRAWFDFIDSCGDSPSDRARVLRAEWGMICGAEIPESRTIEAARIASGLGDWLRAMRLVAEIPTERMGPHELLEVASLYCGCNKIPLGLDILAHCVRNACCAEVVIDALFVWMNRAFGQWSPALRLADFRTAFERLREEGDRHPGTSTCAEFGLSLLDRLSEAVDAKRGIGAEIFHDLPQVETPTATFRELDTALKAIDMLDAGRTHDALELLRDAQADIGTESMGMLHLTMLQGRTLLQLGRIDEAKRLMTELPSYDIAYLTARSGPCDLLWAQAHLLEGNLPQAMRALRAAIEALEYWNQGTQLAIALAEAEYAMVRTGHPEEADDLHVRFDELPHSGVCHDRRRAQVLRTTARAIRTGEPKYEHELRRMLSEAEAEGAWAIVALIRLHLFLHFDEIDPAALCQAAERGTGREFEIIGRLGAALRDKDSVSLLSIAETYQASMPDFAGKCTATAARFRPHGVDHLIPGAAAPELTLRERQISTLIVAGRTNAEIALELGVRVRTVEGHTYRLFRKLGVTRREQVAEAMRDPDGRIWA